MLNLKRKEQKQKNEKMVLDYHASGMTNTEIQTKTGLSQRTVWGVLHKYGLKRNEKRATKNQRQFAEGRATPFAKWKPTTYGVAP